ncbi:g7362 [Coccomyxa elongata]
MEKDVKTAQKVVEGGIAQLANQPTLGLFFLREHVISAAPTLLEDHRNSSRLTRELERGSFDAESASESMIGLKTACGEALTSIEEQLTIATQALTSLQENERGNGQGLPFR